MTRRRIRHLPAGVVDVDLLDVAVVVECVVGCASVVLRRTWS